MSEKQLCPGCGAYTSSVLQAFMDGDPCPYCGVPAYAALAVIEAKRKGADEELTRRLLAAEKRAADAERDREVLRGILQEMATAIEESKREVWG